MQQQRLQQPTVGCSGERETDRTLQPLLNEMLMMTAVMAAMMAAMMAGRKEGGRRREEDWLPLLPYSSCPPFCQEGLSVTISCSTSSLSDGCNSRGPQ